MAYYGFEGLIFALERWGVIDVILPFILIFTISFAILERIKVLSEDDERNRRYSAVIGMVLAFAVIIPHVTGYYFFGFDPVVIINRALPQVALLLVAIVMVLLALGLWTGERADGRKGIGRWFTMASGVIVILIFIGAIGWWNVPPWVYYLLQSDVVPLVIAILVFGLVMKFITGSGKPDYEKKGRLGYEDERRRRSIDRARALGTFLGDDDVYGEDGSLSKAPKKGDG